MIIVTPQEEVDAYRESTTLNQSTLKELQHGVDNFLKVMEKRKEEDPNVIKPHFIFGSAVDTLLTGTKEDFKALFYISNLSKSPSEMELKILSKVFEQVDAFGPPDKNFGHLMDYKFYIESAIETFNWQPNWKLETRINKIIEIGSEYFQELIDSYGKTIITLDLYEKIKLTADSLKNNPRTSKYFKPIVSENPDTRFVTAFQFPVYFTIEGIECKALLDMLIVEICNKTNKVVSLEPIDIKTMSGFTIDFPKSVKSFRYDIQAAWYTFAISVKTAVFPNKFPELSDEVDIKPFKFIVESSTNPGKPLIFIVSPNLLKTGFFGQMNPTTGKKIYKGFEDLLSIYKYHSENGWEEDKVVTDNDGVLSLGWGEIEDIHGD